MSHEPPDPFADDRKKLIDDLRADLGHRMLAVKTWRGHAEARAAERDALRAELILTRAALRQARDAVQPAVDAAVVAAVAAIEAERDSAYAQRDAERAKALEEADLAIRRAFDEWSEVDDRERVFLHHVQDYVRALAAEPTPNAVELQPPGQAGHTSAVGASARGGTVQPARTTAPEDAEDVHSPAFYRVGQTGVERALPVDDAAEARIEALLAEQRPAAKPEACRGCGGTGRHPYGPEYARGDACPICAGTGRAR